MDRTVSFLKEQNENRERWLAGIRSMNEMVLADLVMLAQIPAKTFEEEERARFFLERCLDTGLVQPHTDEIGNVIAVMKGKNPKRRILITAHLDTLFDNSVDHNVTITDNRAYGPGIADNAMGLAVLMNLPEIFRRLEIEFNCELILLATSKSKERGDLNGIRYFIDNQREPIDFNVNIEGITIGQVDHQSLSRVRGDITCRLSSADDTSWGSLGHASAIMMLTDVLDSLYKIPLPRRPKTIMNVGRIMGEGSYSRVCNEATLAFEVRSEDDEIMEKIVQEIEDNCVEIGAKYGVEIEFDLFSRQHAAGLKFSHPLVRSANHIVKSLGLKPVMGYTNSEIAMPLSRKIPAVTLGITRGLAEGYQRGYVELEPIPDGIYQILLLLQAIDKGVCDDEPR